MNINLDVFTTANHNKLEEVIETKEGYLASNSYMLVLAKEWNGDSRKDEQLEEQLLGMLNNGFSEAPKKGYKLSEMIEKEELVECGCCRGSGYEKQCECGVSTESYLLGAVMYGTTEEYNCIACEDTGVVAAKATDEGIYTCEHCNGTGKTTKYSFESAYVEVGKVHLSKDLLQKILIYLGEATFYPTSNHVAPVWFDGEGFEGLIMPMAQREEEKDKAYYKDVI